MVPSTSTTILIALPGLELTLDETYGMLEAMVDDGDADHFTSIVNVKVYSPAGVFVDDFYFTKVWSLDEPVIDELILSISKTGVAGWTTSLTMAEDTVFYRVQVLDQFGNPWTADITDADQLILRLGGDEADVVYLTGTPDEDGYLEVTPGDGYSYEYTYIDEGTYSIRVYQDDDPADLALSTGEVRSNLATYINQ